MDFETIGDIYVANENARKKLLSIVSELTEEQANLPTENGKWTVAGIVEHLAKVGGGMAKICYSLLSKAKENGEMSDGGVRLSESFLKGLKKSAAEEQKFEAPEMVAPSGSRSIEDSLTVLAEVSKGFDDMRPLFESVDGTKHTFPHPYFGAMSAQDWLVLFGGHERRHTDQIEKILSKHE